jgi:hypothetical protein
MQRKLLYFTILALLLMVAPLVSAQEDAIPIAIGEEASGEISGTAATYVFSATAGQMLIVDVLSEDFEPIAEVNDASGSEVAFAFGGDTFASVVFTVPEDGEYFASAGEFMGEGTGAYTIRVREGQTIAFGDSVDAEINGGTDAYTFEGTTGTLAVIELTTTDMEFELELYDSAGTLLASDAVFSSGTQAIIEFLLPADDTYTIQVPLWFATDVLSGPYTLSLNSITPESLTYDNGVTSEVTGIERNYFFFEGTTGDVIHVTADSGTTEEVEGIDVDFELVGPDGEIVATDNSDGPFSDPALTRILLPMDGLYLLKVIPNDDDEAQYGSVDVLVETAELLTTDEGPVSLTLGDRFEQDFIRFTGEPGASYTLTVTPERPIVSFNAAIGEGLFSTINGTVSNGNRLVLDFTVPEDTTAGLLNVSLRQSSFQDATTYEVNITPAE